MRRRRRPEASNDLFSAVHNAKAACAIQDWVPENGEKSLPVSSSQRPEFHPDQRALFTEVLQLLNDNRVPYVISGAFALYEHTGIGRDTKDLDLFLPAENVNATLELLHRHNFRCEVPDSVWLAKAHRNGFFVDLITGMSNGAIVVDRSWVERGSRSEIMGIPVCVLAAEELIASKVFVTRRERFDGADIAHVIFGTEGKLDWERLLRLVGEHWELLLWHLILFRYCYPAYTSYVPRRLWDDLLDRYREVIASGNVREPFRGSLVDELMFAIDVKEWGMADIIEEYRRRREPKIRPPADCPVKPSGEAA